MNEICPTCNGSGGIDTFEESIGEIVTIPCPDCGGRGMNLSKLFEMQRQLDEKIEREHPRQPDEDRLAKKILALMVELGELANEWRGFKFWSEDQVPRTRVLVNRTTDDIGFKYIGPEHIKNPLLEEYVDGLHFLFSIGLDENVGILEEVEISKCADLTSQFLELYNAISNLLYDLSEYPYIFGLYLGLGEMLGFTWKQIEEAYMRKNAVNHHRQENGY